MKYVIRILGIVLLLALLALIGLNYYVSTHKEVVYKELENWYTKNYHGELSVGDVSVSVFKHFPNAAVVINDISITDSLYAEHKIEALNIHELSIAVSLSDLRDKKLYFQKAKLKKGSLHLVTDSTGYSNASIFKKKMQDSATAKQSDFKIIAENGKIKIRDFTVLIEDIPKNKRYNLLVNAINTAIELEDKQVEANVNVEIDINANEVGFNLANGSFFNGARLRGKMKPIFKKDSSTVSIPTFDLKIDDQNFKVAATIDTKEHHFLFKINNPKADFKSTRNLISENIKSKLEALNFSKPINVAATLDGSFAYKSIPLIAVNFSTQKNALTVHDSIHINNATLKGRFVNKYYKETVESKESKKNFRIYIDALHGNYEGVNVHLENSQLAATNKIKSEVAINLKANGKNTSLNSILHNENFLFRDGNFKFSTTFKGNFKHLDQLFNSMNSTLTIGKSKLFYKALNLTVPLDTLSVSVAKTDAELHRLSFPVKNTNHKLHLSGAIDNLTALVFGKNEKLRSHINIGSTKLIWKDFINIFKDLKSDTSKKKDGQNPLNTVLKDVHAKFNPTINIDIGNFQYEGIIAQQLKTGLHYKSRNQLSLKETTFQYKNSRVSMLVDFDITSSNTSKFQIKLNADNVELHPFLKEFDYFNLKALQNTEKIAGNITLKANVGGTVYDKTGLDDKSLSGSVDFDVKNLELKNFEPLVKVGNIVFKKSRVEDVRFAPIKNRLQINNRVVKIPQMEVQSTAFNLYVQGQLGYDKNTNIWLSIPLKNFKKRDVNIVPEKIDYNDAGKKVFVEVKDDTDGKLKYKLHLRNKKLYEEEGNLDEYKEAKKEERVERRAYNKEHRLEKRDDRKETRTTKKEARKKKRQDLKDHKNNDNN